MANTGIIIAILALFYLLGKSADLIVVSVRKIGEKLGIKIFFLGLILGFFTSLPECAVGLNALIKDTGDISFGNLIGGIFVSFGLVLGLSLIMNRGIKTDGKLSSVLPIVVYSFLPMILGLDGSISSIDGAILMFLYFLVIYHAFITGKHTEKNITPTIGKKELMRMVVSLIGGIIFVIIISDIIIRLTFILIAELAIPTLLIGVVFFAIGTNLPEIIVTIRSWKRRVEDLSMSNIIGSALANILIIGGFAFLKPIAITVNGFYIITMIFMILMLGSFAYFYESGREITKNEGFVLIGIYTIFVTVQLFIFL
jgi:cation:H+ antiporter